MKSIFSKLIALFLLLSLLAGCAGSTGEENKPVEPAVDNPSTPETVTDPPAVTPEEPEEQNVLFYDYEFIIRDHDHGGTYDIIPVYAENRLDDMMLERYEELRKTNQCKITLLEGDSDGLIASAAVSEKYADIMYDKINRAYGAIELGLYLDLLSINNFDVRSGAFGAVSLLDSMIWDGKLYVMYPDTWAIHFSHVFYYIPSALTAMNIADPHEYSEKNNWTWDSLRQIAADFTKDADSNDGVATKLMALNTILADSAVYSNGVTWTALDENNRRVIAFDNDKTQQALSFLNELYTGGFLASDNGWEPDAKAFIAKQTAFYGNYSWMGISKDGGYLATNLNEAFSWTAFPAGPQSTGDAGVLTFTNPFFLVTSQTDTDIIGDFATLLFRALGDSSDSAAATDNWYKSFEEENFFEHKSYDYYMKMLDTLTFDYSIFINKSSVDSQFMSAIKGKKTPTEAIEKIRATSQAKLDGYFAANEEAE